MKNQVGIRAIVQSALMLSFVLMLLTFISCNKEETPPETAFESFTPLSGPKGTAVTIKGVSFGTDASKVKVFFNNKEAVDVTLVSDTEITAKVPSRAFTGKVVVQIDMLKLESKEDFIYKLSDAVVMPFAGAPGEQGPVDGGPGTSRMGQPMNVALDSAGNLYVPEGRKGGKIIRKITPDGTVSTFAGENGEFGWPWGIAVNKKTGYVFVGDRDRHIVFAISPDGSKVIRIAGGEGPGTSDGDGLTEAQFKKPMGLAVDANGDIIVADASNNKLRKIVFSINENDEVSSTVTSITGNPDIASDPGFADGDAASALFNYPTEVNIDSDGNYLIADTNNGSVRKVTPNGTVTTIAGTGELGYVNGPGATAQFNKVWGVVEGLGGVLYVADAGNFRIRKIVNGEVMDFLGVGDNIQNGETVNGTPDKATFSPTMFGLAVDGNGIDLYIAEALNRTVRKILQD